MSVDIVGTAPETWLPHRAPIAMIDAIIAVDHAVATITCLRTLRAEEPWFAGHFPGDPIFPGVLAIEAAAQAALLYAVADGIDLRVTRAYLGEVVGFRFRRPVPPGTTLRIVARRERRIGTFAVFACSITDAVDDALLARGRLTVAFAPAG